MSAKLSANEINRDVFLTADRRTQREAVDFEQEKRRQFREHRPHRGYEFIDDGIEQKNDCQLPITNAPSSVRDPGWATAAHGSPFGSVE